MLEVLIILGIIWFGLGLVMILCRFVDWLISVFHKFKTWDYSDSEEE